MSRKPARGDVYLVDLEPTRGRELRKIRLGAVISPDELNGSMDTVVIAPLTTDGHAYPWRPRCEFRGREGFLALDHIRALDLSRLKRRLGSLPPVTLSEVLSVLREMFTD